MSRTINEQFLWSSAKDVFNALFLENALHQKSAKKFPEAMLTSGTMCSISLDMKRFFNNFLLNDSNLTKISMDVA